MSLAFAQEYIFFCELTHYYALQNVLVMLKIIGSYKEKISIKLKLVQCVKKPSTGAIYEHGPTCNKILTSSLYSLRENKFSVLPLPVLMSKKIEEL